MKIVLNELTIGDAEDFEDITGTVIETVDWAEPQPKKLMKALIYISERRKNPAFTLEDARNVKFSDLEFDENPTEAGDSPN